MDVIHDSFSTMASTLASVSRWSYWSVMIAWHELDWISGNCIFMGIPYTTINLAVSASGSLFMRECLSPVTLLWPAWACALTQKLVRSTRRKMLRQIFTLILFFSFCVSNMVILRCLDCRTERPHWQHDPPRLQHVSPHWISKKWGHPFIGADCANQYQVYLLAVVLEVANGRLLALSHLATVF